MISENLITAPDFLLRPSKRPVMGSTGVQWMNPLERSSWDTEIMEQNHSARSFFHGSAWANVLTETYGFKPFYFVTNESGSLGSLLPLMEIKSPLTGSRGVSLPFTDTCDPLCGAKTEFKELFRNAVELGKARRWDYLEFRGGQKLFNQMAPSVSFYGHDLDVSADENTFFGTLKSPVRRAIRKAEKTGVRVEVSQNLADVKSFYALHCLARKKHGLPPQPFSFFKNIHKHILAKNLGIAVLARWKKTPIAGSIFFHSGASAIYKFGASDESFQHLRGNNLVFWEAIRWLSRRGAKKLDFGRTSMGNEGLRRFKLGWNATEKNIDYFRYSLKQEKFISASDESSGWHNRIFRALPLSASQMIGHILYRHWA